MSREIVEQRPSARLPEFRALSSGMDIFTIAAGALGGFLPDDAHREMVARFWEHFPQFEHMRGVIEAIVAARRAAAARLKHRVQEIKETRAAERDALWDEAFAQIQDQTRTPEFKDHAKQIVQDTGRRSKAITRREISELKAAYAEDMRDLRTCFSFLVWQNEREELESETRLTCA